MLFNSFNNEVKNKLSSYNLIKNGNFNAQDLTTAIVALKQPVPSLNNWIPASKNSIQNWIINGDPSLVGIGNVSMSFLINATNTVLGVYKI